MRFQRGDIIWYNWGSKDEGDVCVILEILPHNKAKIYSFTKDEKFETFINRTLERLLVDQGHS